MRFKILVEDSSSEKMLKILIEKIIGHSHKVSIDVHRGKGHLPKKGSVIGPRNNTLLGNLPRKLQAFGNRYSNSNDVVVIVVCDLDGDDEKIFLKELNDVLNACQQKTKTYFCLAIEESEAWFLGDPAAIQAAYPKAKIKELKKYEQDSICGTWECLADVVFRGGASALSKMDYPLIGVEKEKWVEKITPHMNIDANTSPSFNFFRDTLRQRAETTTTHDD